MKVIVTGGHGLVGAKFSATYGGRYQLVGLQGADGQRVDITDRPALEAALAAHPDAQALLHLAAYTDVNGAYAQTGDKTGAAWQVNVVGTGNIARTCAARGLYLIHVSTAFVFDGQQDEAYREDDLPHPIEWYGQTKYEAEKAVTAAGGEAVILRIDQPFSSTPSPKIDTLWRVITGLRAGTLYPQFVDHYFGPTSIEQLSRIFDFCLRRRPTGLYHASSGERFSDLEFATLVRDTLGLSGEIKAGSLDDYLRTTKRPYQRQTVLNIDRLRGLLDFELTPIRTVIAGVKLESNNENR